MNTMKWLLRREYWEHKGMFLWAPIVVAIAIAVLIGGASWQIVSNHVPHAQINGQEITAQVNGLPPAMKAQMAHGMAAAYMATAAPIMAMLALIVFFYCLGALYDERRDRSILFWKSLPVSDGQTVLSKVASCLVVMPLLYIAVSFALSVVTLTILSIVMMVKGVNIFPMLLSQPRLYLAPLQVVGLLPVYAIWALPTIGWLLMVSSWARSKVFLWAVGVPVMITVILKIMNKLYQLDWQTDWFVDNVVVRVLTSTAPGTWLWFEKVEPSSMVDANTHIVNLSHVTYESYATLTHPAAWIGAIAGAAMIYAAMRLRRYRDEG